MSSEPHPPATSSPSRHWLPPLIGLGLVLLIAAVFLRPSADPPPKGPTADNLPEELQGPPKIVRSVHHTSQYTILELMETEEKRLWLAAPRIDVEVGDRIVYADAREAENFHSPSLKRTFEKILLTGHVFKISAEGKLVPAKPHGAFQHHGSSGSKEKPKAKIPKLEKPEGGQSIAEIAAAPKDFAGKAVKVRGMVVSALPKIRPGRDLPPTNWYRIQDGSGNADTVLPFTSDEHLERGDIVVITGTLSVDKQFESGLSYEMIVEDARLAREKPDAKKEQESP